MALKKGIKDLVAEAEKEITTLTVEEAIKAHEGTDHVFVDVRDVRELERDGMIPGALHAPRGMIEFWFDPESPYYKEQFGQSDKTYVLYCRSAWRGALATKALQDMGLENVVQFEKGFQGWIDAGGPVADKKRKES